MADARMEFSLGGLTFSAEGEQEWLSAQLDKVLAAAPQLQKTDKDPVSKVIPEPASNTDSGEFTESLASHIKAKGGDSNQVLRFLATADWLRRKGDGGLTTAKVAKALADNHQKKLGNPADCLNKNVAKGHCEKNATGFFITPDGLKELKYS